MSKHRLLGTISCLALGITAALGQNIYPPVIPQSSSTILPLNNSFSGNNTFTGNNTFSGNNSHTGKETFLGITWTGYATPEMYGATIASSDNSAALQSAFASGNQIWLGGTYKSASPITVTACPSIAGEDPSTSGILFTGSGNGLTINCNQTILLPQSGKVNLQSFGIYTSYAGAGTPLKLNFAAQAPAYVPIATADVRNIHVSGQNLSTEYWTGPVTCINCYGSNWYYNWISGKQSDTTLMSSALYFTNSASGVPFMVNNIIGNQTYGTVKGLYILAQGSTPEGEGFVIDDNSFITNVYGIYIDESAASYYPPQFDIRKLATNSTTASVYVNHISDVYIQCSACFTNTNTGDGIDVINSLNVSISADSVISATTLSTGYGVRVTGTGPGNIMGGFYQNWAQGINLDSGSTRWVVNPIQTNTVTTNVVNAGAGNLVTSYNPVSGLFSFNGPIQNTVSLTKAAPPTLTSCGTSPSAASGSTNQGGSFTTGSGSVTSCQVNFATIYPTNAYCTVTVATNPYTTAYWINQAGSGNNGFSIDMASSSPGVTFNYACNGN